jgi:mannose-6-phosphate isomerase-like protein (cupin superfamily)
MDETVQPVSIATAVRYEWGQRCEAWHFVNRPSLSVIRERMPPGSSEARHFHTNARQFFFVLKGTAALLVGDERYQLSEGQGLEIPPGTAHQISNAGDVDLNLLVISHPHSHGDRTVTAS